MLYDFKLKPILFPNVINASASEILVKQVTFEKANRYCLNGFILFQLIVVEKCWREKLK